MHISYPFVDYMVVVLGPLRSLITPPESHHVVMDLFVCSFGAFFQS
jgi:hypothetical protein